MDILTHIQSPCSAPWVAWLLLAGLIILLLNVFTQAGVQTINVFSRSERVYTTHSNNWMGKFLSRIYGWGIVGLMIALLLFDGVDFAFLTYLKVLGIVALVYFLQWTIVLGVGWVFVSAKDLSNALEQYRDIRSLICMLLYPVVLFSCNYPNQMITKIMCGIVVLVFIFLIMNKMILIFYKNLPSLLYILLYIFCLEILPIAIIFFLANEWVIQV